LRKIIRYSERKHKLSLRAAFAAFDKDGKGHISRDNFETMLRDLGFHPTSGELNRLFLAMDSDDSGTIELREFETWVERKADKDSDGGDNWRDTSRSIPVSLESVQRKCKAAIDRSMQESKAFDIEAMFLAFDRTNCGEVNTTGFRYVLMDMKLQLLEGDEVVLHEEETRRRAERMSRQLARIEEWHGQDGSRSRGGRRSREKVSAGGDLIGRSSQMQKFYKLRSDDLQLVRRFRESRKRALVGTLLKSNITAEFKISPSFGRTMFFEYQLTNPYSHEERFTIDCSDPELRAVTDSSVWQHYRETLQPCAGVLHGPVEHEMISADTLELTLKARETVSIPFVFLSFASGTISANGGQTGKGRDTWGSRLNDSRRRRDDDRYGASSKGDDADRDRDRDRRDRDGYSSKDNNDDDRYGSRGNRDERSAPDSEFDHMRDMALGHGTPIRRRTVPVSFKSAHHGHTVALLQVHIRPQPFIVHRTFRFHQSENEFLKRRILIQPGGGDSNRHPFIQRPSQLGTSGAEGVGIMPSPLAAKFVHCPASDVVVEWRDQKDPYKPQEIHLRYRCGAFPSFGQFFLVVYNDQYHASLHEVWHVTVQSMLRVDVHGLVGQGTPVELMVKGDNYARRVKCFSSHAAETGFHPPTPFQLVSGAYNKVEMVHRALRPGTRHVHVHMVDVDTKELVAAWLVTTSSAAPIVSRTYDVDVAVGKSSHKKIAYLNKWDRPRNFSLRTSEPSVVKAKDPRLQISARGKGFIRLWFAPVQHAGTQDMFIFVNDEEDQNEECLMLRVRYS